MNIPNLPTDNLYKFVSITGVFLALVCFLAMEYRFSQQAELDTEVILGIEALGHFMRGLDSVHQLPEEKHAHEKQNKSIKPDHDPLLSKRYEALEARVKNIDQEIMGLRKKSEIAENHSQRTQRIRPLLLVAGLIGIALACIGFYLWYHRLQKYQDFLIKVQAVSAAEQINQVESEDNAT